MTTKGEKLLFSFFFEPKLKLYLCAKYLIMIQRIQSVYLSGVAEIVLGIGVIFPQTRSFALCGLIAMLIIFLIVHVNMLFPGNQLGISPWILWLRIPIQFILIYWAYLNLPPASI